MNAAQRAKAILILSLVFMAGGLCGMGGAIYYLKEHLEEPRAEPAMRGPERRAQMMDFLMRRLSDRLELSSEQQVAVRAELETFEEEAHRLREEIKPRLRELMQVQALKIEKHLLPEQLEVFRKERMRLLRPHRGGGGPQGKPPRGDEMKRP